MTTILPSARTPLDVITEQLGYTLGQTIPRAVERQQGLSAIDRLQQDLEAAGGDITKMLPSLLRAQTLNPALERSRTAETLIPLMQRKAATKDFPAGGGMPTKPGGEPGQEVPVSAMDLVSPRQSMVQNPQGVSEFQLPFGPEEFSQARQKARELSYLPEQEERFINDMNEFNKVAATRREIEIQNYNQQQQQRRDTLENQDAFEKYLVAHSPEFVTNKDELELALKASEKYQKEPSFAERNAKVKEELRPYQAAKNALEKTLKRPLFGYTKDQLNLARPRAQFMVEMGQKPQLQAMIAKGGQGEVEEALLLNPLSDDTDRILNSLNRFIDPLEKVNVTSDSPEYMKQLQRGSEIRLKQREDAVKSLSNLIEPGRDYAHPGTNLLLVRKHLMDKKAPWQEAGQIIDEAIKIAGIKLDPQQQIDFQKLAYPPLTGENYSDTILNNIIFPLTGKE